MISIIIVDDEKTTRQSVARFLDSMPRFRVVGQASDGLEALELIDEKRPDILITDISMPHMDGLELVQEVRERGYPTTIIIMSGHSEFKYAQKAISFGVEEYLLKPFMPADLETLLTSIAERLESSRFMRGEHRSEYEYFLNALLSGELETPEILRGIEALKLPLAGPAYLVGFLRFYHKSGEKVDRSVIWPALEEKLMTFMQEGYSASIVIQSRGYPIILFSIPTTQGYEEVVDQITTDLVDYVKQTFDVHLWFGFSQPFTALSKAPAALEEAEKVYKSRCALVTHAAFYEATHHALNATILPSILGEINDGILALSTGSEAIFEILDRLAPMFEEYAHAEFFSFQVELLSFVLRVSNLAKTLLVNRDGIDPVTHYLRDATRVGSLFDTMILLRHLVTKVLREGSFERETTSDVIVSTIKQAVAQHLDNEDFRVEDAITGLNYSYNYIRHIFTQSVGVSIKDYLIQERINFAKHLLTNTSLTIKEITQRTGYRSQHYFSYSFKEVVGVSPSEYRKQ